MRVAVSMVVPLIVLGSAAVSSGVAHPSTPKWEPLPLGVAAPGDALRLWGNVVPDQRLRSVGEQSTSRWRSLEQRAERFERIVREWGDSATEAGLRKVSDARERLNRLNPVLCRARFDGSWSPGVLDEAHGVCRLFVALPTASPQCRSSARLDPECVPLVPIAGGEVYVLRHATGFHLLDLSHSERGQALPDVALVSLTDGVFHSGQALCVYEDHGALTMGTALRDRRRISCVSGHTGRSMTKPPAMAYANREVFLATDLASVRRFLTEQGLPDLRRQLQAPADIGTVAQGERVLAGLDGSMSGFQAALRVLLAELAPMVQGEAAGMVQELAGDQLRAVAELRARVAGEVQALRVKEDVSRFEADHIRGLVTLLEPLSSVSSQDAPDGLESAIAQRDQWQFGKSRLDEVRDIADREIPDRSREAVLKLLAQSLGTLPTLLTRRLEFLGGFIATEKTKESLDTLAAEAEVRAKTADTPPTNAADAAQALEAAEVTLGQLERLLGETVNNPAVVQHRATVIVPAEARLRKAVHILEPLLSEEARVDRLRTKLALIRTRSGLQVPMAEALGLFDRLLSKGDGNDSHGVMLEEMVGLRRRLVDRMGEACEVIWRCEAWEEGCDQEATARERAFCAVVHLLPGKPGSRASSKEGKALSKAISKVGFSWKTPGPSDTGESYPGAFFASAPGWLGKRISKRLRPAMRSWLACRSSQVHGQVSSYGSWLSSCHKAGKDLGEGPLRDALADSVRAELKLFPGRVKAKKCKSLLWDRRNSFFGGDMGKVCADIKAAEGRAAAIHKAAKSIDYYKERKQFQKAREKVADLQKAGAPDWRVQNSYQAINAAETYHRDKKAREAAARRARKMMQRLPSYERICKSMNSQWNTAIGKIRWAVGAGKPSVAEKWQKKKIQASTKACAAQAKVYEVHRLYKAQGNSIAADQVLQTARTCHRSWTCN